MPEDDDLVCPVFPRRHHLREPQRLPRPVQEADLREFFAVIEDTRDRAMFTLMLRCGLRIGEVASLQLSDLYLDEDFPRMVVHGKGSRERAVYLSPQAVRMLQRLPGSAPRRCLRLRLSQLPAEQGFSTHAIHMRLLHYRQQAGLTSPATACGIPLPTTCSMPICRSPAFRNSWAIAGSRPPRCTSWPMTSRCRPIILPPARSWKAGRDVPASCSHHHRRTV